jgi:hypothetical protein
MTYGLKNCCVNYKKTNHKEPNHKRQGGATLLGMLVIGILIVFVAIVVMNVVPAYTEFFVVKKALHDMQKKSLSNMSRSEIVQSFDKRAAIDSIESIKGSDLNIEKSEGGETIVTVDYQVVKPIMGNVSVLINFSASSDRK